MMVDPLLEDDAADRPEPGGERLLVAGGDVERIGKQRAPPLHVEKPGRPTEGVANEQLQDVANDMGQAVNSQIGY